MQCAPLLLFARNPLLINIARAMATPFLQMAYFKAIFHPFPVYYWCVTFWRIYNLIDDSIFSVKDQRKFGLKTSFFYSGYLHGLFLGKSIRQQNVCVYFLLCNIIFNNSKCNVILVNQLQNWVQNLDTTDNI